ncbi:HD family phosphohydrolase [Aeoliella sp. SH292]|uniref:HD family phosphohydrolase n=1 Tax=Aeoliella sp. SH292 TaxID=3454464 RepID=UPI003F979448
MSSPTPRKTRSERVAAVELPPGRLAALLHNLRRGPVLLRLAICALVAVFLWVITASWAPPLDYHLGEIPHRNVVARTNFSVVNEEETARAVQRAADTATAVYTQNPKPIIELKNRVLNELAQLAGAASLDAADAAIWKSYQPVLAEGTPAPTEAEQVEQFVAFKKQLNDDTGKKIDAALNTVFKPLEQWGILKELPREDLATSTNILIQQPDSKEFPDQKQINDVLLVNVRDQLQRRLQQELPSLDLATKVFARLSDLPATLTLNEEATRIEREKAAQEVLASPVMREIVAGDTLARAGRPISDADFALIEAGYKQEMNNLTWQTRVSHSAATFGMYLALYTLCGFYIYKLDPRILRELGRFVGVLATVAMAVALMTLTFRYHRQAEVIPLLLFGMTMAVAYSQPLALLLSSAVTLIAVMSTGTDLHEALVLIATTAGAIIVLDSVRTRSKLLSVGFVAAGVAFFTNIGVGTLAGDPFLPTLHVALWLALWAVIAGSLMTCILPLVEKLYNVQTDLSLLELGDPAHPLLQELVRRAPGTYNHSINVASLAEAAAESIGARGLLVRVGAYFHDIGKMLKPGYFIENQSSGGNRHDSLVPAMSTLVIIAHVKDGADLARQNRLPEPIIDFIQQHHGTTLVEYFYRQATDRRENNPDAGEVDESSFRYPGPKPQTKEAGVLMLADAVESASRVLVEPTPSRIENLVEELTRKRLLDGQFDECGLTLEEVRKIGDSLVKSLTAVYHGRVRYPAEKSAKTG